ncbi:3D domain-containing protein [Sulfoacidibacillus thermotolerans]|uniref:3D domain-containing protein n=1 Tax=Sulfoacidibacillus thermotolerans TaxID=1765684 RepID=A0A2U3DCA7_SULT2|nr:3D domain-containing protein [Sulfoacidibacillus thermotolerans]PWI58919.1 hypothetical protein BM613_02240 [Sulfoacidibacillus thermotolerans]
MVPFSNVIAYGAFIMFTTVSTVPHANSHIAHPPHTNKELQHFCQRTPSSPDHFTLHQRVKPIHHNEPNLQAIEAMATLNPVLPTAEALGHLAVVHTYDCKLTAYSADFQSTGKNPGDPGYGITATGKVAKPKHTVAVDPNLIPLGSLVYIDGIGYRVAEDIGGAIKGPHIDVFFADENDAKIFGVKNHVKVYVFGHNHQKNKA